MARPFESVEEYEAGGGGGGGDFWPVPKLGTGVPISGGPTYVNTGIQIDTTTGGEEDLENNSTDAGLGSSETNSAMSTSVFATAVPDAPGSAKTAASVAVNSMTSVSAHTYLPLVTLGIIILVYLHLKKG